MFLFFMKELFIRILKLFNSVFVCVKILGLERIKLPNKINSIYACYWPLNIKWARKIMFKCNNYFILVLKRIPLCQNLLIYWAREINVVLVWIFKKNKIKYIPSVTLSASKLIPFSLSSFSYTFILILESTLSTETI